jgi:hypothetical protein
MSPILAQLLRDDHRNMIVGANCTRLRLILAQRFTFRAGNNR